MALLADPRICPAPYPVGRSHPAHPAGPPQHGGADPADCPALLCPGRV